MGSVADVRNPCPFCGARAHFAALDFGPGPWCLGAANGALAEVESLPLTPGYAVAWWHQHGVTLASEWMSRRARVELVRRQIAEREGGQP